MSLKVYPNPVINMLHIEGLNTSKNDLFITNVNGIKIAAQTVSNTNIDWDIKNLLPGVYFLSVYEVDKKKQILKFIKQ